MIICVFNIVYWDNQVQANKLRSIFPEWEKRVNKFCPNDEIYLSLGSYSNPKFNPTNHKLIQLGIEKQLDSKDGLRINYFRCGLLAAFYYFLLHKEELNWDIIAYIHYSTLIGTDLKPYLKEFQKRSESFMAPQLLTSNGILVEPGLMFLKEAAVKKWILNGSIKDPKIEDQFIIMEEEAALLFEDDWYNPFTSTISIRQKTLPSNDPFNNRFNLTEEAILNTPFIFGLEKHCDQHIVDKWKQKFPVEI